MTEEFRRMCKRCIFEAGLTLSHSDVC